jgi:hypothetical protein
MPKNGISHTKIPFTVFKINWIRFVWHCGHFTSLCLLQYSGNPKMFRRRILLVHHIADNFKKLEGRTYLAKIAERGIAPHVLIEVNKHSVELGQSIKKLGHVVMRFNLFQPA